MRNRYQITPIGKPRMTVRDKWKQRPPVMRYRAFCDEVRLHDIQIAPANVHIIFIIPMPKSWSQKKRNQMDGQPHQQKPDIDNLTKSLLDALFDDDSHIWDVRTSKVWGEAGQIIIEDAK
ncbi:RusA family crossover junction endodeoxyribonuclease [Scandinavium goeteborgense]|uniref:RusA family crossover junction endodeoxyribonuclease n=1 Tax=Scandinavium goeteborgense TaxID=1851514 RepID=UPI000F673A4A|nr:RusA family crossover junction endodeoxyribonuclease [Scandinavium goeteborgense]QKN82210.1 RusA family crossover junction endodeoxyribonuclease [Scandinavium goeteborgense]